MDTACDTANWYLHTRLLSGVGNTLRWFTAPKQASSLTAVSCFPVCFFREGVEYLMCFSLFYFSVNMATFLHENVELFHLIFNKLLKQKTVIPFLFHALCFPILDRQTTNLSVLQQNCRIRIEEHIELHILRSLNHGLLHDQKFLLRHVVGDISTSVQLPFYPLKNPSIRVWLEGVAHCFFSQPHFFLRKRAHSSTCSTHTTALEDIVFPGRSHFFCIHYGWERQRLTWDRSKMPKNKTNTRITTGGISLVCCQCCIYANGEGYKRLVPTLPSCNSDFSVITAY